MNTILKLPYSFVPCATSIYVPHWAHQVSHDIPFRESYSGAIDVTLTNHGYLCVGGTSGSKDRDKNKISSISWAKTPDGKTVIPGSSIKGMLRNDAEIICFGKFQQFTNKLYAFRDVTSSKTDYFARYKDFTVSAAWIKLNDDGTVSARLCSCAKAFNGDINTLLKLSGDREIKNSVPDGGKNISRTADGKVKNDNLKDKYLKAGKGFKTQYKATICDLERKINNGIKKRAHFEFDQDKFDSSSAVDGYLVFTNYRVEDEKIPNHKKYVNYSYFYYDIKDTVIDVSVDVYNKFERSQSPDTKELVTFLKNNQHKEYGFPVWVFRDKKGVIQEIGICRMPRLLYQYSIDDKVNQKSHNSDYVFDLPELMFGTIRNGDCSNFSLKSRIGFSDFISNDVISGSSFSRKILVLQEPKTSFTDGYLVNDQNNEQTNYQQSNSRISGWKRYKVQETFANVDSSSFTDAQKSEVEFLTRPGNKFKGTILFHNLRKEELGALLYVIKFWDNENCFHMLGHAKPYGAGAVKMHVDEIRFPTYETNKIKADEAIESFKSEMRNSFGEGWESCIQYENLRKISQMHRDYSGINDLVYNKLDDFRKAHNNKDHKEHFLYETKSGNKVSTNTQDVFSNGRYYDQLGKLLRSDARVPQDEKKRIANLIAAEKEQERKQKLSASRSEFENRLAEFLDKYRNVVPNSTDKNVKKDVFEIVTLTHEHLKEISKELLISLRDYLQRDDCNKKKIFDSFTKVPEKQKKNETVKEEHRVIKAKMKDIMDYCNN